MTNPDSYNPNVPSDWRRVGAFIIDCLPWAIVGGILVFFLADQGSDYSGPLGTDIPTGPELIISLSVIVLILVSRILMEVKSGASLGRLATGTKVIDERTGQTISPLNSLIRNAWIPLSWVLTIFVPLGGCAGLRVLHRHGDHR